MRRRRNVKQFWSGEGAGDSDLRSTRCVAIPIERNLFSTQTSTMTPKLTHYSSNLIKSLWKQHSSQFTSKKVPLLKQITSLSAKLFRENDHFASDRLALGKDKEALVLRCALDQNFENVREFTDEFYQLLAVASKFQSLTRGLIAESMRQMDTGFHPFDAKIIEASCELSNLWDEWYVHWLRAVQGNETADKLKTMLDKGETIPKEYYNRYTIIDFKEDGSMYHRPYFTVFREQMEPMVQRMNQLVEELRPLASEGNKDHENYIAYFEQYAKALRSDNIEELEAIWDELDVIWMHIKTPIGVVHDSEYGYGDPLRCKVIPDFSLRFIDPQYEKENQFMENTIKAVMADQFKKRNTELANQGLFAFGNSLSAVYYLPFSSACSLHFRFSGQALPNSHAIRSKYGVKIYFDPVATAAREVQTKNLVQKVMHDADKLCEAMDPLDTITFHVCSHELGHSIYGLDAVREAISVSSKTLLEEPRAELTALATMLWLYRANKIEEKHLQNTLVSFAMQDLRRFAMYDSSALRPYTISATNCYNTYERLGYMSIDGEKIRVDLSKTVPVLEELSRLFEGILDAEDKKDGEHLEGTLSKMQEEGTMVKWLIDHLFEKKE